MPERKNRDFLRDLLLFAFIVLSGALVFTFLIKTLFNDEQMTNAAALVAHLVTVDEQVNADSAQQIKRLPSESARKTFTSHYAAAEFHKAFSVSKDGYWGYATQFSSPALAGRTALWWCEKSRVNLSNQDLCKVVHIDGAWLSESAEQALYRIDTDLIQRGIMPLTQEFISGEYAQVKGHKALASNADGYYGYAFAHKTAAQAVKAAMKYCKNAARKQAKARRCKIQLINDKWQ